MAVNQERVERIRALRVIINNPVSLPEARRSATQELEGLLARVKRIIQALQEKTAERGCSEQEALEAAEKMGELMEEYDLSIDEVGVKKDAAGAIKREVFAADDFAGVLITGIKRFCDLIAYQDTHRGTGCTYVLFGTDHDVQIAVYLYEICAEAMEHDWAIFMEQHGYSMKKRLSFRQGFSSRVYERLKVMKDERDARTYRQTGTALVLLKNQIVKSEFDKLGIKLRSTADRRPVDPNAYRHGQAAGGRVNLNNPLSGGPSHDRIR